MCRSERYRATAGNGGVDDGPRVAPPIKQKGVDHGMKGSQPRHWIARDAVLIDDRDVTLSWRPTSSTVRKLVRRQL